MIATLKRLEVISKLEMEMINLTSDVERLVSESGVKDGVAFVITAHTTSSIVVTEGVECLERDIPLHLERLAPKDAPAGSPGYYHNRMLDFDGRLGFNAADHLKSVLGGVHAIFPIENGRLVRGSRQNVYFVEYDGPLARTVFIQILGTVAPSEEEHE